VIIIILLALTIGLVTYFVVKAQIGTQEDKKAEDNHVQQEDTESGTDTIEVTSPTLIPVLSPTPTPPLTPTPSPVITPTIIPTLTTMPTILPEGDTTDSSGDVDAKAPVKVHGIYVTAPSAGTNLIEHLIEVADTTEINAMVIDIKDDHGKITYRMTDSIAEEIGATSNTISDLDALIKSLKEKDIYLIARIVAFKDPYLAEARPDLAVKNSDGTLFRDSNGECWVNPYNQEVWDYLMEVATKAAQAGFDEIQFDYIRFSTGKGIANADFGKEAETKTKSEAITEFTKYAYETLKPLGVFVSADVYGAIINSSIDAALVGQNYVQMAKYLDYICPMIYPSHFGEGNYGIEYPDLEPYNIVQKALTASQEQLNQIPENEHKAIVRPWLQDFTASWIKKHIQYGPEEIRSQIDAVYSVGYEEWILWNAASKYTEDGLLVE